MEEGSPFTSDLLLDTRSIGANGVVLDTEEQMPYRTSYSRNVDSDLQSTPTIAEPSRKTAAQSSHGLEAEELLRPGSNADSHHRPHTGEGEALQSSKSTANEQGQSRNIECTGSQGKSGAPPSIEPHSPSRNGMNHLEQESAHVLLERSSAQNGCRRKKRENLKRTKSGCLPCRQRKKKCDERRPQCGRCMNFNTLCWGHGMKTPQSGRGETQGRTNGVLPQPDDSYWTRTQSHVTFMPDHAGPSQYYRPVNNACEPQMPQHEAQPGNCLVQSHPWSHARQVHHLPQATEATSYVVSASNVQHSSLSWPSGIPEDDRSKMLQGRPYNHFADMLVQDRLACELAVVRYNSDASAQFAAILDPCRWSAHNSATGAIGRVGYCGKDTVVERPFQCFYGYTLSFGSNTHIASNCYFQDPCEIIIGNRVTMGPRCQLFGIFDPAHRRDGSRHYQGGSIFIEDDAWIGGDVIIMGLRIIGRGATVRAGSVVTRNVRPYTVVAGNPAEVVQDSSADEVVQQENDHMREQMLRRLARYRGHIVSRAQ